MNVLDQFRLDGRVAVVTGGSRGLGKVMAEALASAGASVVVTARTVESAQPAADEIAKSTGAKTLALAVEMLHADQIQRMVDQTLDTFGSLDILVNNAGINRRGPIEELTESDFDEVIGINLKGPWLCCRAASKPMKAKGWGRVINLSSMMAEISLPGRTPYCSSKGGLSMMTKTLALEWARDGITVNNICPGPFATEMNIPILNDPQVRETFTAKIPLGRWGEPRELGPVAVFLASEASSFVTGASIFVDGGYTCQ